MLSFYSLQQSVNSQVFMNCVSVHFLARVSSFPIHIQRSLSPIISSYGNVLSDSINTCYPNYRNIRISPLFLFYDHAY